MVVTKLENSTFKWYSGYEVLDISPSDVITAAEFELVGLLAAKSAIKQQRELLGSP